MFFYSDTADALWTIIKSNDKKRARLNCMRHFLAALDYPGKDLAIAQPPDPLIVGRASHVVHAAEHILGASLHPDLRHAKADGAPVIAPTKKREPAVKPKPVEKAQTAATPARPRAKPPARKAVAKVAAPAAGKADDAGAKPAPDTAASDKPN